MKVRCDVSSGVDLREQIAYLENVTALNIPALDWN